MGTRPSEPQGTVPFSVALPFLSRSDELECIWLEYDLPDNSGIILLLLLSGQSSVM